MIVIKNRIKKFIRNVKNYLCLSSRFSIFSLSLKKGAEPVFRDTISKNSSGLPREQEFKSCAFIGTEKMREMLKSMEELKEANDDIFSLIKIIDDMAFQTNMLVLNSAAEEAGISNGIEMIFAPPKAYS